MDLHLVDCFLRIAEFGSINRAAADMEMTQPALSRRIAALEHDLGTQLFVRDARGVKLTDAGTMLANGARPILRQAELLRAEIGQQANTQVSVGLPFSMHRLITAPFAANEIQTQPSISLRIYEGFIHHLREFMQQGLIDVAVMDYREDDGGSQWEQIPLIREQLLLVGSVTSGLSLDRPIGAMELGSCKLIVPGRPNIFRLNVDTYLKRHGQKFRRAADAETLPLCLALVKDGLGYTVMPYCALHEFQHIDLLRFAPISDLFMTWSIYINKARRHTVGVRNTATNLKQMMTKLVADGHWPLTEILLDKSNS
jgi:LysR family nitrogen assimilation transcriptional regulator